VIQELLPATELIKMCLSNSYSWKCSAKTASTDGVYISSSLRPDCNKAEYSYVTYMIYTITKYDYNYQCLALV
jgi:hypothetical protein